MLTLVGQIEARRKKLARYANQSASNFAIASVFFLIQNIKPHKKIFETLIRIKCIYIINIFKAKYILIHPTSLTHTHTHTLKS